MAFLLGQEAGKVLGGFSEYGEQKINAFLKYVFLNWLQLDGLFPWQLNQTISGIFVI